MVMQGFSPDRPAAPLALRAILLIASLALAGAAGAQAPTARFGGYMRIVSASGHVMAGESTDPDFRGWIPLRQTTIPAGAQMAATAEKDPSAPNNSASAPEQSGAVHPPIVVVKDRDGSSLVLLAACTSRQHFSEVDIALTDNSDKPARKYKLTDATILSVRAGGGDGGEPVEQLRISYAKIEVH